MKLNTKYITMICVMSGSLAYAASFSFGPTGGAPVAIPGSNDGSGGTISYSSTLIWGGTAGSNTHEAGSGTVPGSNVGGTYDGTFFDSAVDGDNTLTTSIQSTRRRDIDNGIADDYSNYIGICVTFTAPISMDAFGFIDLDGAADVGQNEWVGSFATLGGATVIPTINLGDATNQGQRSGATVDWSGITGAPTTYDVAFNSNDLAGEDPDSPSTQTSFDYGGNFVDQMYFVWGLEGDQGTSNGNNASGVTAFQVDETVVVPEPSSYALLGLGALGLLTRRKRA